MRKTITKTVSVNGTSYELQVHEIESKNYEYVTCMYVASYKKIIETPGFNSKDFNEELKKAKINISLSEPPADSMSKQDLRSLDLPELISCVNTAAEFPKDLIYMYSLGFGFSWGFFTDLMEYLGCKNISSIKAKPQYIIPDEVQMPALSHGMKIVEIGHKWTGTQHKAKFYLNDNDEALFQDILGGYSQQNQSKVISVLIAEKLSELKAYQDKGMLRIKYQDILGEELKKTNE
ncbi:MAG: hypothetical protein K6G22_07325 [Lachnospiraceae bacterium]|nr:hypothetical protein [Lachnospiraceae bacterium]